MYLATVDSRYRITVPKLVREKIKGFIPGAKVSVEAVSKSKLLIKVVH